MEQADELPEMSTEIAEYWVYISWTVKGISAPEVLKVVEGRLNKGLPVQVLFLNILTVEFASVVPKRIKTRLSEGGLTTMDVKVGKVGGTVSTTVKLNEFS